MYPLCLWLAFIFLSYFFYKLSMKYYPIKPESLHTLIGKKVKVHSTIGPAPFNTGAIKTDHTVFPAITQSNRLCPKGTWVCIEAFEDCFMIVTPQEENLSPHA